MRLETSKCIRFDNKSGRKAKNEESFVFPPDMFFSIEKKSIFNLVNLQAPVAEGALSLVAQQAD